MRRKQIKTEIDKKFKKILTNYDKILKKIEGISLRKRLTLKKLKKK